MHGILASSSPAIDSGSVTEVINLAKQCMGLFGEFPLNIFLIGGLCTLGFAIFKKAKSAAK
ncbi:MAG: hypothetical protein K2P35_06705 [Lachnospiraceae bacterium]|nr:hypothetical protein [Lachnospiraceae bacterium]